MHIHKRMEANNSRRLMSDCRIPQVHFTNCKTRDKINLFIAWFDWMTSPNLNCIFNPSTHENALLRNKHWGYWYPGAKSPGHHYPRCWASIYCIVQLLKDILHLHQTTQEITIIFWNDWPSCLRVKTQCNFGSSDQSHVQYNMHTVGMCFFVHVTSPSQLM